MEIINITSNELSKTPKLKIDDRISNSESIIYKLHDNILFKYFYDDNDITDKINLIKYLEKIIKENKIEEFVLPINIVKVDNVIKGYTMTEIKDCYNFGVILNDLKINKEIKIIILEKIGKLINKIYAVNKDIIFNDLHEYNFLVDRNLNIYVVDIDSIKIKGCTYSPSHYLYKNNNIGMIDKYECNPYGITIPSRNGDILCYISMLFKLISEKDISLLDIDEYNNYLSYLRMLGYGDNIINSFRSIYENKDNINPVLYLKEIPIPKLEISTYKHYQENKRRKR